MPGAPPRWIVHAVSCTCWTLHKRDEYLDSIATGDGVGKYCRMPVNTQFRFIISAVVQDETGASCAVGSTTKDIDPNQPANSARNKARATLLNARPAAAAKIPGPFQRQLTLHLAPGTQRRVSFTLSLSSIFNVEVHGTLTVASGATTLFTSSVLMHIPAGSPAILHIPDVSIPDGISDVTISIAGSSLPAVPTGAVKLGVGASSL